MSSSVNPVRALARAARPRQWPKNILVFAAPTAAGVLGDADIVVDVLVTFGALCLVSSGVYLVNDLADVEEDRRHPTKRDRPIAAGHLTPAVALVTAIALFTVGVGAAALIRPLAAGLLAVYLFVSLAYSAGLKRIPVVDIVIVASGFVLRAGIGAAAADVPVSSWFLTVMGFGALAVAAGKRSSELSRVGDDLADAREVLSDYPPRFLEEVATIAVGGTLVSYALWAFDRDARALDGDIWFELSMVPIAVALLRYLLLIARGDAEEPEVAMTDDVVFAVAVLAWGGLFAVGAAVG